MLRPRELSMERSVQSLVRATPATTGPRTARAMTEPTVANRQSRRAGAAFWIRIERLPQASSPAMPPATAGAMSSICCVFPQCQLLVDVDWAGDEKGFEESSPKASRIPAYPAEELRRK